MRTGDDQPNDNNNDEPDLHPDGLFPDKDKEIRCPVKDKQSKGIFLTQRGEETYEANKQMYRKPTCPVFIRLKELHVLSIDLTKTHKGQALLHNNLYPLSPLTRK